MHTSPSDPSPQLGPLANERAVSSDVTLCRSHSGREILHQFLPILLRKHALSSIIMTPWSHFEVLIFWELKRSITSTKYL